MSLIYNSEYFSISGVRCFGQEAQHHVDQYQRVVNNVNSEIVLNKIASPVRSLVDFILFK
jgi:hypothetical protein